MAGDDRLVQVAGESIPVASFVVLFVCEALQKCDGDSLGGVGVALLGEIDQHRKDRVRHGAVEVSHLLVQGVDVSGRAEMFAPSLQAVGVS